MMSPEEVDTHVEAGKQAIKDELAANEPFRAEPSWADFHTAFGAMLRFLVGGYPAKEPDAAQQLGYGAVDTVSYADLPPPGAPEHFPDNASEQRTADLVAGTVALPPAEPTKPPEDTTLPPAA